MDELAASTVLLADAACDVVEACDGLDVVIAVREADAPVVSDEVADGDKNTATLAFSVPLVVDDNGLSGARLCVGVCAALLLSVLEGGRDDEEPGVNLLLGVSDVVASDDSVADAVSDDDAPRVRLDVAVGLLVTTALELMLADIICDADWPMFRLLFALILALASELALIVKLAVRDAETPSKSDALGVGDAVAAAIKLREAELVVEGDIPSDKLEVGVDVESALLLSMLDDAIDGDAPEIKLFIGVNEFVARYCDKVAVAVTDALLPRDSVAVDV